MNGFLFIGLLVVVAIVAGLHAAKVARLRREALASLASRLGLSFSPDEDRAMADRFEFLDHLATGDNRYAFNVLSGKYREHEVLVFEYHYETTSRDSKGDSTTDHHYFSFFVLLLPVAFPELRITREGMFSKIAQAFGYDDIDFESAEFSRTFCVRSKDKKFAYDVCNPRMIEFLLANRDLSVEIEKSALAFAFSGSLSVPEIESNLGRLFEIRSRLPGYLFAGV